MSSDVGAAIVYMACETLAQFRVLQVHRAPHNVASPSAASNSKVPQNPISDSRSHHER
jgi:hypothetical protein